MLINSLRTSEIVNRFIVDECCENGFAAEISNEINVDDYVIIKVDNYYNSLNIEFRPPSPDCLIIVRCNDGSYSIYIVELRNIGSQDGFSINGIREKFHTCLFNFMMDVLSDIFLNDIHRLKQIRLYFITDPYDEQNVVSRARSSKSSKMDALLAMNTRPFVFDGKYLGIEHKYVNPLILPC